MPQYQISIRQAFGEWWLREREHATPWEATGKLAKVALDFLRDSLPSRRRQRYGDADYDWEFRVDTTSATISWRARLLGLLHSPYQPIPPEEFREIMPALMIDCAQFTFIDIGSGKGRALLLAAEFPFRRIIGIEVLPELDRVARENIRKVRGSHEAVRIELLCQDATQFAFPNEPSVVFLFNPLPESSLLAVLKNLQRSLIEFPRIFYLAYANPEHEQALAACSWLRKIVATRRYSIFSNSEG